VHLGDRCSLRAHEGTLRIGEKTVLGREDTLNCYLDLEIGPRCIVADWVYVGDFDHRYDDLDVPVKDQGIVKTPVSIGADVWIGVKASVLRGAQIGDGCVVGAHAVVKGTHPAGAVLAGVPARVLRKRGVTEVAGPASPPAPLRAVDEGGARWRG
jgi:acetyltransferase-like isoleucine patch superfamily enzyme